MQSVSLKVILKRNLMLLKILIKLIHINYSH